MNIYALDKTTDVHPLAKPEFWFGQKHMPAILLVHGFTGSPYELRYLGSYLAEQGYTVSIPRLPGHGTNREDFLLTGWRDWYRKVVDSYLELKQHTPTVYCAGLSMGGVLTLLLASQFPIERIMVAAPAVDVFDKNIRLTPFIAPFLPSIQKAYEPDPADPPDLQELRMRYQTFMWIKPGAELNRLINITRNRLRLIKAKTLVYVSEGDKTVPTLAAKRIERALPAELVKTKILTNSNHLITCNVDKEFVASETLQWFQ
jgi:carboxylesterase